MFEVLRKGLVPALIFIEVIIADKHNLTEQIAKKEWNFFIFAQHCE